MKKAVLFICSFVCAYSAPIELCASFECEDCYSIHVLKADSLVKNQWVFKDSVECECGMWLSPSFVIKNLPGNFLSGAGGGCVLIDGKRKKMKMPSMPQMILRQGDVVYTAYTDNAKKGISSKFKQTLDFYWKVRFECQGNSANDTTVLYKLDAILVGECQ